MKMMRCRLLVSLALVSILSVGSAYAGTRLVHAIGRAAIAGKDTTAARKSALAEALYDAAGQVRMVVRGSSFMSQKGTIHEESGVAVSGSLKGYQVVDEHREGDHYVVAIDALADTDDGECSSTKKSDISIGGISVRVAPNIAGVVERQAREGVEALIAALKDQPSIHVIDDRRYNPVAPTSTTVGQNMTYLAALSGHASNPGAYSISGTIHVDLVRSDNIVIGESSIEVTADLQLVDNVTGAVKDNFSEHARLALEKHVWGSDIGLPQWADSGMDSLWTSIAGRVAENLGCESLRAVITQVSGNRATLSAGSANGIKPGDFFLVELPSQERNSWQLIRVESAGASQSVARLMKATPAIPPNSVAVLLQ
jgi:hypothetical protein